jgi:hypothetical protein
MRKIRKINVAYIVLQKTMDLGYARVPAVENDALVGHFTWLSLHLAFEAISSSSATAVPVFSNILRSIVMASSPGT